MKIIIFLIFAVNAGNFLEVIYLLELHATIGLGFALNTSSNGHMTFWLPLSLVSKGPLMTAYLI